MFVASALLLALQPDFGSLLVLAAIFLVMVYSDPAFLSRNLFCHVVGRRGRRSTLSNLVPKRFESGSAAHGLSASRT